MTDKQPSFSERIQGLKDAAANLEDVATTILDEVERMEAAERRFADRRSNKKASR